MDYQYILEMELYGWQCGYNVECEDLTSGIHIVMQGSAACVLLYLSVVYRNDMYVLCSLLYRTAHLWIPFILKTNLIYNDE